MWRLQSRSRIAVVIIVRKQKRAEEKTPALSAFLLYCVPNRDSLLLGRRLNAQLHLGSAIEVNILFRSREGAGTCIRSTACQHHAGKSSGVPRQSAAAARNRMGATAHARGRIAGGSAGGAHCAAGR